MTTEEIERRAKVVEAMRDAGATEEEIQATATSVWKPDEEPESAGVEAEGASRYPTILLEDPPRIEDYTPGQHHDTSSDLADLFLEAHGVTTEAPPRQISLVEAAEAMERQSTAPESIEQEMVPGPNGTLAPVPTSTLRPASAVADTLLGESSQLSTPIAVRVNNKFSGEVAAGGAPIPAF